LRGQPGFAVEVPSSKTGQKVALESLCVAFIGVLVCIVDYRGMRCGNRFFGIYAVDGGHPLLCGIEKLGAKAGGLKSDWAGDAYFPFKKPL
jgi:hypothetical protein